MSYVLESNIRVKSYDHSIFPRASVVQFRASRYIMSPNWTSVLNVMTIWICRELPLFNFERLDELCPRIEHSCEKLWPFKFVESFRCWISSVSIYYVPESDMRVKSYDHSNLSTAFVVQFRASRCIMSPNRTSEWNVMTIRISRELPLLNFERLDELCPRIGHPGEKLRPFEFLESFRCSISSVLIYYVPESNIRVKSYDHLNFSRASLFNFESLDELCPRIENSCENLWPFEFLESFRCSISSVSIYYVPESDIRVKIYDHSNLPRASVVQFRASRYIIFPNRTSVWKLMTIRISRVLPLFNFVRLDELCPRIEHSCEKLWPFDFPESFRCSISSVSIYYVPESNIRVKC